MTEILIIKTAALGDVLRTTSILPGLKERHPGARVHWLTASGARELVEGHPLIDRVWTCDVGDAESVEAVREGFAGTPLDRVLSFDDEEPLCRLATELGAARLSGAYLDGEGRRAYTDDVAPWFDMGLLSRFGKEHADRLKVENERTHPEIFADMLGIAPGRPELVLGEAAERFAERFVEEHAPDPDKPWIGLNTGAGGRWHSKQLPVERSVELARTLDAELETGAVFFVFGGPAESGRNAEIVDGIRALGGPAVVDAGCDNGLLEFAALVDRCDLLVTSDSLALHLAIARRVRSVSFFAPTSAAEIEVYGLGERVASTAPDYCSYRPDADNATITVERLRSACLRQLGVPAAPRE